MRLLAVFALLVPAVALPFAARSASGAAPVVDVVRVDGIIGPATARYVLRGLTQAGRDDAQALVIELDTRCTRETTVMGRPRERSRRITCATTSCPHS